MNKIAYPALLALFLSACRIDMTIVGEGTVTSQSGSFNCTTGDLGDCTQEYLTASSEILVANPAPGWTFVRWTNCQATNLYSCYTAFSGNLVTNTTPWIISATFERINSPIQAATYTYNAQGQRITKKVGAVTTLYQYDLAGNLIAELNSNGQPLRQHIHINNEPIAQLSRKTDGSIDVQYVHTDHLSTPTLLTNQYGKVVADIEATPFGELFVDYAEVEYNKRFEGQYKDVETGLHYNYFRDYDPSLGRYIQSDPIGLQGGLNTYTYAGGNPINNTDPLGMFKVCRRPLSFMGNMMTSGGSGTNLGLYHQQGFFEDAGAGSTGFTTSGLFDDWLNESRYQCDNTDYNDSRMRQAATNIASNWNANDYNVVTNNCQDYIDDLIDEYMRISSP